jgi:AP-3 complex subunit delta-1
VVAEVVADAPATAESLAAFLASLFAEPLRPLAPKAQKKVPVPDGLDLDEWISDVERKAAKKAR